MIVRPVEILFFHCIVLRQGTLAVDLMADVELKFANVAESIDDKFEVPCVRVLS